jgi:multidrug resistance efflux pump
MTRIPPALLRIAITIGTVALALIVGLSLWNYYMNAPWTRDGRVRADVVAVAPDVSGLVTEVLVHDNQDVKKGDVLFRVDPDRYEIALKQAEATVEGKKAASEQLSADFQRYAHLSETAVSQQKVEEARSADLQAKADLERATADRDLAKLNLERSTVELQI